MADVTTEQFNSDGYLRARFNDVHQETPNADSVGHRAFQSVSGTSLRVLDYGCGPVVQNSISAAARASEIVFCEANRTAVEKWLKKDPAAFDRTPHFNYVVQTLEGKGEEHMTEREEKLRKVARGPVRPSDRGLLSNPLRRNH